MLCMIPINNIALGTLPPARMKDASGLYNLTRNLGGAVGLALINTVLNDRWDLHLARLHERFTWTNNGRAGAARYDTPPVRCAGPRRQRHGPQGDDEYGARCRGW